MRVRTTPGQNAVTLTALSRWRNSARTVSEMATTACLEAL